MLDRVAAGVHARVLEADSDRGDVPGWVLITIMTAGLVTVVWGVASDQLQSILRERPELGEVP